MNEIGRRREERNSPEVSLVIVVHDMTREAPRTLRSLLPPYQKALDFDDYEILVIENSSQQPLMAEMVTPLGRNVRYFDLNSGSLSPAAALNFGVAQARGQLLGAMVDGARMASPGLVDMARRAARLHPRPIIASLAWHLGPDVQWRSRERGYDQSVEDDLLEQTRWWEDGYRLFSISALAGSSTGGWLAPIAESNSIFLPRELWNELGGYDERFTEPGGGFVNLDFFRRACQLPESELIVLLGEGTFHQFHGGIATNARPEELDRMSTSWANHYRDLRGEEFAAPTKTPVYFGSVPEPAKRWFTFPVPDNRAENRARPSENQARPSQAPFPDAGPVTLYLELLKKSVLEELYLENEVRLLYLRECIENGERLDLATFCDVRRQIAPMYEEYRRCRDLGQNYQGQLSNLGFQHTTIGRIRLENIHSCLEIILAEGIQGDLIECGVWRGGAAVFMRGFLAAHCINNRCVWVADSFRGLPEPERDGEGLDLSRGQQPSLAIDRESVEDLFDRYGLLDPQVRFLEGWFRETLPSAPIAQLALLRIDADLHSSTTDALESCYSLVAPGGFVIIDDYLCVPQCRRAVDEFITRRNIQETPVPVDWAAAFWRKSS